MICPKSKLFLPLHSFVPYSHSIKRLINWCTKTVFKPGPITKDVNLPTTKLTAWGFWYLMLKKISVNRLSPKAISILPDVTFSSYEKVVFHLTQETNSSPMLCLFQTKAIRRCAQRNETPALQHAVIKSCILFL